MRMGKYCTGVLNDAGDYIETMLGICDQRDRFACRMQAHLKLAYDLPGTNFCLMASALIRLTSRAKDVGMWCWSDTKANTSGANDRAEIYCCAMFAWQPEFFKQWILLYPEEIFRT